MTPIEFLTFLRNQGVQLWVDGIRLRYQAPAGVMTAEWKEQLTQFKQEILALLGESASPVQSQEPPIAPIERAPEMPLSFSQQRLWFLDQLSPGTSTYNLQRPVKIRGPLVPLILEKSLNEIIRRHEVLRTTFPMKDGRAVQVISAPIEFKLSLIDLRSIPALPAREAEANRLMVEEAERPFEVVVGPLFRAVLLRMANSEYILVMTMHHIVSDGWSAGVIFKELSAIYEALAARKPHPLPELSIQYVDFAHWQRQWLQGAVLQKQIDYWKKQLQSAPTTLDFPTDRPRPSEQTFRGGTERLHIPKPLADSLQAVCRQEDVTLYMLLLAGFFVLLQRHSGQKDILVGSPIAGRNRSEIEKLVGFFVNTLVMRGDLEGNPTFHELLQRVRPMALGAYAHQDLPFERLVEELHLERDLSRSPLFQVVFNLLNFSDNALRLSGFEVEHLEPRLHQSKFDLTLNVTQTENGLQAELGYNADLFDAATMARLLQHYRILLEGIAIDPLQRISALPILTETERHQLLFEWNNTETVFASTYGLHQRYEARVEETPNACAVRFEDRQITYVELNRRANQLAHCLKALGVGPEVLVGLYMERSLELVVGVLGILKSGGAYLPLDPVYPQERIAFMVGDAGARVVLTQERLKDSLPPQMEHVICLDSEWELMARESDQNLNGKVSPENLAYVIYTSGSTGKPKGTMVTHRNVARLFGATDHWFHFGPRDVWTFFHSHAFDFSVWELWGALLYGGRLIVVPYLMSRSPESFYELLVREKVTVLNQTPSAFRQLIQAEETMQPTQPLALRLVIFGGEALELQSLKPWFDRHGDERPQLVNMYGITETTVHVTYRPLKRSDLNSGSVIGVPIPDLQVYLLDPYQQPVPMGVTGEIYVGGAGVARGYLNRPQLNQERFLPDPFQSKSGARLYRSGDLARHLANGDLEYLGRMDHQVKIRGFRIELGEIESVLNQHPAVRESLILVNEDIPGNKRLVAYLVRDPNVDVTTADLRAFLKGKLPDYMLPAAFVLLEAFPLTPNGKVDRQALPKPDASRPDSHTDYKAPRTPIEQMLSEIWAEVLRLQRVSVEDNFFELGGDSILSIQVISRARQAGLEVTPRQLFQHQTISELAAVVRHTPTLETEQGLSEGAVFLTPIQHWFFEQELEEIDYWNQAFLFELLEPLDVPLFEKAVNLLIEHHDSLRLRFIKDLDGWRQHYANSGVEVVVKTFDFSELPDVEQGQTIFRTTNQLQSSFNLSTGPLFGVAYFNLGEQKTPRLFFAIHHLVVDGVSWRILFEDLESIYKSLLDGNTPSLPRKTSSYQRWSERLMEWAQSGDFSNDMDYWSQPSNPSAMPIPVDFHGTALNLEGSAGTVMVALSKEQTRNLLQKVPAAYNTQINDVLLTALVQAFTEWVGDKSLWINLEGHGREDVIENTDVSRTVGWFTSIFPVQLTIDPLQEPSESLKSVKEQIRRIPNRGLGYGVLRYLSPDEAVREKLRAVPQPQVSFNYLGQFDQMVAASSLFRFASEAVGPTHSPKAQRRHWLDIVAVVVDHELVVKWTYSERLHRRETIERLSSHFMSALRVLIDHCLSPAAGGYTPSDFPLARLHQKELDRILGNRRGVEDLYPLSPIQQLFFALEGSNPKIGFEQWHFELQGALNVQALRRAWELVLTRHSILRTGFESEELKEPVQIVYRQVKLTWDEKDWSRVPEKQQWEQLNAYVETDCSGGFDLSCPPLTRVALIRFGEHSHHLIWSTHHLQIDGWSWPLVLTEVSSLYQALCQGQDLHLDKGPPYRNYIAWLQNQRSSDAEAFWRKNLLGYREPVALWGDKRTMPPSSQDEHFCEERIELSESTTDQLLAFAREHQLTPNTIVQGAWALLLSHYSARPDVVFGATFSGRPADLRGVEKMVGPFVNNLPVRTHMAAGDSLIPWLKQLQSTLFELDHYQHTPLIQIQGWSEVPWRHRLFESLLVFQNYVVEDAARRFGDQVEIHTLAAPAHTNYPFTLMIIPRSHWWMKAIYQSHRFSASTVRQYLQDLHRLLEQMLASSAQRLENIFNILPQVSVTRAASSAPAPPMAWRQESDPRFFTPSNELEGHILKIWQEAFQMETIGMYENFFELGGYSLLMVRVHAKLQEALRTELSIVKMFQYPTISSLAKYLGERQGVQPSYQKVQERSKRQQDAFARSRQLVRKK